MALYQQNVMLQCNMAHKNATSSQRREISVNYQEEMSQYQAAHPELRSYTIYEYCGVVYPELATITLA